MTKTTKIIIGVVLAILVIIVLSSKHQDYRIGVISPVTGMVATFGEQMIKVVNDLNSGVKNIIEDDQCDPKRAVSAFTKLSTVDKTPIVIGPLCGSPQEAIAPIVKDHDVIAILPLTASEKLYSDSNGKIYNLQNSIEQDAMFIAKQMYDHNYKRVAVISHNNSFSKAYFDTFVKNFKGEIVFNTTVANDKDVPRTDLIKMKSLKPEALFVSDVTFFLTGGMKMMKEYNINIPVYSQYSVEFSFVRPLAEGVYYSYPVLANNNSDAIYDITQEAYRLAESLLNKCGNNIKCIKENLDNDKRFNKNGIFERPLVLKVIENGNSKFVQ